MTIISIGSVEDYNNFDKNIKKSNSEISLTDFAIINGAFITGKYIDDEKSLDKRIGYYWTNDDFYNVMGLNVYSRHQDDSSNTICCRPIVNMFNPNDYLTMLSKDDKGVTHITFGEFPQMAEEYKLQKVLEKKLSNNALVASDTMTFNNEVYNIYEYNNRRYIRTKVNTIFANRYIVLSNNESYKNGDYVWIKVSPMDFSVNKDGKSFFSDKLLFNLPKKDLDDYLNNEFKKNLFHKNIFVRKLTLKK